MRIDATWRRIHGVFADPVLRRWLLREGLPRLPDLDRRLPPYLEGKFPCLLETPRGRFAELASPYPESSFPLRLPGECLLVEPGAEDTLFDRQFADVETGPALHRFAWLPLLGNAADPAWVTALWGAWRERFGEPSEGIAWHPYTAAERAINILDFGRRIGLPAPLDDTLAVLAAHGPAIAERLEYFGDHNTSNHLANNGRGLYLLGLTLGMERCAALGSRILIEEAKRIFLPSGVLREGSGHYHLLLARQYASTWLAARAHGRSEASELEEITRRAMSVIPHLRLPGGAPLIGDISPDCPPDHLVGLFPGACMKEGWTSLLAEHDRALLGDLITSCGTAAPEALAADGWLRADHGPWSGLWHADPAGWSQMPGHGHQDMGGFELHHHDEPLFIDVGRGSYNRPGESDPEVAARAHNTLTVDEKDPYPPNKPYYDNAFRRRVAGPPPELRHEADGVSLRHHGFSRLKGIGAVERGWRFREGGFSIEDSVKGMGRHRVTRLLHTPLEVSPAADGVVLTGRGGHFLVRADAPVDLEAVTRWTAYGEGQAATRLRIDVRAHLPWQGRLRVEKI